MHYLLDTRYKTLHSLALNLRQLVTICEQGLSDKLYSTTTKIQEALPLLETYQSPPFQETEIAMLHQLHKSISVLLYLPEDVVSRGKETLSQLEIFLSKVEPFTLSERKALAEDKQHILDLLHNLKIYLQVHILDLEGTARSIIDELKYIQNILNEIKEMNTEDFEEWAQENLIDFFLAAEFFQKKDSIQTAEILLQRTLDLEFSLQSTRHWYCKEMEERLSSLLQIFLEAEEFISSEEPLFSAFKEKILSPPTEELITKLRVHLFHDDKVKLLADTVLFSYEVLATETGNSFASRCRFLDFFQLFSNATQDLYSFFLKAS